MSFQRKDLHNALCMAWWTWQHKCTNICLTIRKKNLFPRYPSRFFKTTMKWATSSRSKYTKFSGWWINLVVWHHSLFPVVAYIYVPLVGVARLVLATLHFCSTQRFCNICNVTGLLNMPWRDSGFDELAKVSGHWKMSHSCKIDSRTREPMRKKLIEPLSFAHIAIVRFYFL